MWSQSWVNFSVYRKTMISIEIAYNKQCWWYQSLSLFTFACVNIFYEWQVTMKLLINIYYKLLHVLTRSGCIFVLVSFIISLVTYFTLFYLALVNMVLNLGNFLPLVDFYSHDNRLFLTVFHHCITFVFMESIFILSLLHNQNSPKF